MSQDRRDSIEEIIRQTACQQLGYEETLTIDGAQYVMTVMTNGLHVSCDHSIGAEYDNVECYDWAWIDQNPHAVADTIIAMAHAEEIPSLFLEDMSA
jgi:hypothetical protein